MQGESWNHMELIFSLNFLFRCLRTRTSNCLILTLKSVWFKPMRCLYFTLSSGQMENIRHRNLGLHSLNVVLGSSGILQFSHTMKRKLLCWTHQLQCRCHSFIPSHLNTEEGSKSIWLNYMPDNLIHVFIITHI